MAKKEKPPTIVMTDGKREIIRRLLGEYDIKTAEDIQDALKDLLGGTIKEMMEAEMSHHLGYEKSERLDSDNTRNGHKSKKVRVRVKFPTPSRNFTALRFPTASSATLQIKFCRKFRNGKRARSRMSIQ